MKEPKRKRNLLIMVTAVAALATIALWQFYVFATFRNANGQVEIQGGSMHLWLAFGFALIACMAAIFGASFLLRYDRNDEMHITSAPHRHEPVL